MKKWLFFIIVLLLVSQLCGCSNVPENIPNDLSSNRFIYSAKWFGRLICYDLIDKKASVACPDPLCEHGADCPVSEIQWYYISGDNIAFIKYGSGQSSNTANELFLYDLKAGNIELVKSSPNIGMATIAKHFIYFSSTYMEYDENGKPVGNIWEIFRYDINTKELKKLNSESIADRHYVYYFTDELLYWTDDNIYYTTNYDYENNKNVDPVIKKGDTVITLETDFSDPYSTFSWIVGRKLSNGETETVVSGVYSFGDDNPEEPKGMIFNSYHHNNGNTIFYMDYNTFEIRKLCDLPEGIAAFDLYTEQGSKRCLGNYVGIYVNADGISYEEAALTSESIMFIDINTGEYFVLTP